MIFVGVSPLLWTNVGKIITLHSSNKLFKINLHDQPSKQKHSFAIPRRIKKPRIAIIGGGIAGVTAAASIASKFPSTKTSSPLNKRISTILPLSLNTSSSLLDIDITIYEADSNYNNSQWKAATCLNAQSMVPSVSMHCFSQVNTLYQVMKDWICYLIPYNTKNLEFTPPSLMFSFLGCLGLSCTWPQRVSFISFLYHFLSTSLTSSSKSLKERGVLLYELSKANRMLFMQTIQANPDLAKKIGYKSGFLSLHRYEKEVQSILEEAQEYEFEAQVLSMDELKKREPILTALPIQNPMFAILRPKDSSSNCAIFIQDMIEQLVSMGVRVHVGCVKSIHFSSSDESRRRFQLETVDGTIQDYDYVVLAAGASTPLLAQAMGVSCPTYPLRGWSLTLICKKFDSNDNILNHGFSFDRIYGSSTSPYTLRLAGFGELVGYDNIASTIQSHAPEILTNYAKALIPKEVEIDTVNVQPCFRPLSPDDIPIVGKVSKIPGLFLHSGHGTLGWTTALATAECLGQCIDDEIRYEMGSCSVENSIFFMLPGGSLIHRSMMSPDRFG